MPTFNLKNNIKIGTTEILNNQKSNVFSLRNTYFTSILGSSETMVCRNRDIAIRCIDVDKDEDTGIVCVGNFGTATNKFLQQCQDINVLYI